MRGLVLVLLLLAAAKVGYQQYAVSTTKTEIIVAAYRDRAIGACERAAKLNQVEPNATWARSRDVRLVIRNGSLDVSMLLGESGIWSARSKNPYLFLSTAGETYNVFCEFDIVQGHAAVYRM